MSETFGIVAGAVGLPAVFSTCMEVFNCVQLGRTFERDYDTSLITLRLQGLRLSRWGAALEIYDDTRLDNLNNAAHPDGAEVAKNTLCQILRLFSESEKKSKEFLSEQISEPSSTVYSAESITNPQLSDIIQQTNNIMVKRTGKGGQSLRNKITWALYERESFGQLIQGVSDLLDGLEKAFPATESQMKLADEDIAAIKQAVSLEYVQKLAEGVDQLLQDRAKRAQDQKNGRHFFEKVSAGENSKLHSGNAYVKQAGEGVGTLPKAPGHHYGDVRIDGRAVAQTGDMIGGSVFD